VERESTPAAGDAAPGASLETRYIRAKVNQLLQVMGTAPLRPEELDDRTLIDLDPIGIVAESFRQILEHHRRTNEQLAFAREELQAIFDSAGLGIMLIGRDLSIEACNAQFRRQFGLGDELPAGRRCHELVCSLPDAENACPFLGIFRTGEPCRVPDWVIGERHFEVVGTPLPAPGGGTAGVVLVYADITERLSAEEALRRSEERYRDLFESVSDLVVSIRLDGSLEFVNAAWCETLGYDCSETASMSIFDLLHPDCDAACRERIAELLRSGRGGRVEAMLLAKDGRVVLVEGDLGLVFEGGRPVGIRGILHDITKKEALEAELRKREKLESVGLLAGGIAHDFNNLLTAILGNIDLALLDLRGDGRAQQRLREAERATISARDLTQQLLTFAKGGAPVKTVAALGEILREQAGFAVRGSSVVCEVDIAPDLWPAEVDTGQIGQVVHNLVLNATQAMPGGGRVRVTAENLPLAPREDPVLHAGRYLRIRVHDEGHGIPAADLQRIFEPYFTTKKGGSGLGLAVTYSIVKKHDGVVRVESEPGRGTTFTVLIPATDRRSHPRGEAPAAAAAPQRGRILVVDDERDVRDVAGEMLAALGCEADPCADGAEAVRRYEAALGGGRGYAAVILDLTIPGGMGGSEAARRILEIDPDARLIVSSGYSNDPILSSYAEHGFRGRIAKPYRLADLAAVIRQVVGGQAASAVR